MVVLHPRRNLLLYRKHQRRPRHPWPQSILVESCVEGHLPRWVLPFAALSFHQRASYWSRANCKRQPRERAVGLSEQALHENRLSHRQMVWNFHPPSVRSRRPNSPLLRILRDELPALWILHSRSLAHPQAVCAISDHSRISRERVAWH